MILAVAALRLVFDTILKCMHTYIKLTLILPSALKKNPLPDRANDIIVSSCAFLTLANKSQTELKFYISSPGKLEHKKQQSENSMAALKIKMIFHRLLNKMQYKLHTV